MMGELKPCPFCRERERVELRHGVQYTWGYCGACRTEGPLCGTDAEAIAAWNRRPDATSAGEEFTAVRGVWKNQSLSRLERVRAHRAEFGSDLKRAIEAVDREAEHQRLAALPAPPQADGGEG